LIGKLFGDGDLRRAVSSGVGRLIPVAVALWLALWNGNIGMVTASVVGAVSVVVTVPVEYVLTYSPVVSYRDRQLSTFFRRYLELVERDIEEIADGDVEVRANVMRPSSDGFFDDQSYSIAFYADEEAYDDEEFNLEFEPGQACVGHVHESGDQEFAISTPHARGWDDGWNTTSRQDRVTSDLNTVIGTPIFEQSREADRDTPAAVLIIDSEDEISEIVSVGEDESITDIEFENTRVADRAASHASDIGILL
jgi:hypothetical protein